MIRLKPVLLKSRARSRFDDRRTLDWTILLNRNHLQRRDASKNKVSPKRNIGRPQHP